MTGPLWAQVLVFFAVAIPIVLLATHTTAWLVRMVKATGRCQNESARTTTAWAASMGYRPYRDREEYVKDAFADVSTDDMVERRRVSPDDLAGRGDKRA